MTMVSCHHLVWHPTPLTTRAAFGLFFLPFLSTYRHSSTPHYPLRQSLSQMKWWCWIVTIPPPPPSLPSCMAPPIQWWCSLGEFSSLCTIEQPSGCSFFFFCTDYWVPLPYRQPTHVLHTRITPFQPVYCFYNIILSISHPFCVQPMGLHHPCILNICIAGPCPVNFSTCLLLLQVVLRSLSRGPYLLLLPHKFFKLFTTFANGTQIIVSRAISFLLFAYLFCSHAMWL